MDHLHAPWRMEYIGAEPQPGCLFCRVREAPTGEDRANLVIRREPEAIALLNRFPYNPGHLMVAPRHHFGDLTALGEEELLGVMMLMQRCLRAVAGSMQPDGFNVGINMGKVAGAGIADHVHVHAVPRWDGDTNFMPVLADVKVVNEHLERTWGKLTEALGAG